MAQYVLYELWNELGSELEKATVEDIQGAAETFDDRTRHFSAWAGILGQAGNALSRFLAEQATPVTYSEVRQHFPNLTGSVLQGTLDALQYHGLIPLPWAGQGMPISSRRANVPGLAFVSGKD